MPLPTITQTQNITTFEIDYGSDKVQLSIVNGEIATVTSILEVGGGLTITVGNNIRLMVQAITDYQTYMAANP